MNERDITKLIADDGWMMDILRIVKGLHLPDWWIGAGFVRGKIWDTLHGYTQRTELPDIDVIYFDKNDFTKNEMAHESVQAEITYEKKLTRQKADVNWSVTNQARMHIFHKHKSYKTSEEALSYWVETATCIGVRLDNNDNVILTAPRGINDLVNLILRPNTHAYKSLDQFTDRINKKKWLEKWPKLKVVRDS